MASVSGANQLDAVRAGALLKIGEILNYLFERERSAQLGPSYDDRRWFRRFSTSASTPGPGNRDDEERLRVFATDVEAADTILAKKIVSEIPIWQGVPKRRGVKPPALQHLHIPPRMPYDVFAAAAYLVDTAGVYHHIQPAKRSLRDDPPGAGPADILARLAVTITQDDRDIVQQAAEAWRSLPLSPVSMKDLAKQITGAAWTDIRPLFESWWMVFVDCAECEVLDEGFAPEEGAVQPTWWKHAWRLFAIADEAAKGTGYQHDASDLAAIARGEEPVNKVVWFEYELFVERAAISTPHVLPGNKKATTGVVKDIGTMSIARRSVLNILPKVRTPEVGCTLRSLSHHLALLPPEGVAKGRWTPNYLRTTKAINGMPDGVMNLLLVPMPYSITADCFQASEVEVTNDGRMPRYGYFDVAQKWLETSPAKKDRIPVFVEALVNAVSEQTPDIHGIVLPELALDYPTFGRLRDYIRQHVPTVDMLVAGVSSNERGRPGNFVAVASFRNEKDSSGLKQYRETVREKHHRWQLERSQLRDYGLLGTLSPELAWWENIQLASRKVDFTVLRRESVFAAMICEDLARVDPCQQVIRAVGPNLVFALLMDAPQLAGRWPARYATVLAEDPGCSVLTLTSRGLMTRQHRTGTYCSKGDDRVIAMWRDDRNAAPIELKCPYDAQAVLLTVVEEAAEDISLDGRCDTDAKAWRYVGNTPVRVPKVKEQFADILGSEDLACW